MWTRGPTCTSWSASWRADTDPFHATGPRRYGPAVGNVRDAVDEVVAETRFSGVVRVDRDGGTEFATAYGAADRAHGIPNAVDTQFGIASGVKGFTALVIMSLVEDGTLELSTTARSVLDEDLPLIGPEVTVEHLLTHTSGIGDHFDEDVELDITDYVLPVPVHTLVDTEQYLPVLAGLPPKFPAGERFSYCNAGYIVLALIAERVGGAGFHELVTQRVCGPAGMDDTAFLRSDELPGRAAVGYLSVDGPRTNVLHLPVRGSGDGGIYTTAEEVHRFWTALYAGRIVPPHRATELTRSRNDVPEDTRRYGAGFWLHETGPAVYLEGYDAGVSFRTRHDPVDGSTYTVLSNTSEGAWPISRRLEQLLDG